MSGFSFVFMILIVLMICSFAVATTEFVLVGMLPEISGSLGVSVATAGLLVTIYMGVVTVGGPAAAVLTRRVPRRPLLIATMAVAVGAAGVSALAGSYAVLMAGRMGSALAQALFMAVASQIAMAAAPPEKQTAAVARVFNGFALATVIGLPVGTLVGDTYGWRATFVLVGVLSAIGLAGVLAFCPPIPAGPADGSALGAVRDRRVIGGLSITLFAFTGFVAAFTFIAPALREVTGATGLTTGIALVVYGAGTIAGNAVAGRIKPERIAAVLPIPLAVLAAVLLTAGLALQSLPTALISVFALGASAFVVAPVVQTALMGRVGAAGAGFIAAVNISVAGLAGALGAAFGSGVLSAGLGLAAIGPLAAPIVTAGVVVALVMARSDRRRGPAQTSSAVRPELCDVSAA